MFVHAVYFSLRDDLSATQKRQFDDGLESLCHIDGVRHAYIGVPAATNRPVIDRGYSRALTLIFDDEAGHDAYQDDPVHDRFRKECSSFWTGVRIFDSIDP